MHIFSFHSDRRITNCEQGASQSNHRRVPTGQATPTSPQWIQSYAAAILRTTDKQAVTAEEAESYEEMFPPLGGVTGVVSQSKHTGCASGSSPIGGMAAEEEQIPQAADDLAIATAVQAEEYGEERVRDFQETEAEYVVEYEPDDYSFDLAVSESLTFPQPRMVGQERDRGATTPMPTDCSGLTTQSLDDESVDELGSGLEVLGVCEICMDRPKNATLLCGHRFCHQCACQMRVDEHQCAICRRPIFTIIKTYN